MLSSCNRVKQSTYGAARIPDNSIIRELIRFRLPQMKNVPRSLSSEHGGDIQTQTQASGALKPTTTIYQVSVPLESSDGLITMNSTGVARIHVGRSTVGQRLWRLLCNTFRFEL